MVTVKCSNNIQFFKLEVLSALSGYTPRPRLASSTLCPSSKSLPTALACITNSLYVQLLFSNLCSVGGEWVDQFAHISFGHQTSSSVLIHHLSARLVHTLRGVTPHATLPLCRMVWWVFQVWVLYNDFVRRIGLQQLAVGE